MGNGKREMGNRRSENLSLILLPLFLALAGCSVALHGHRTTSGGATTTTASAATRAGASFGTPAPRGAPGGQLRLSGGAAAVLVLGLVVAETINYFSARSAGQPQSSSGPQHSIADTCSCYGYQPRSGED